MSWITLDNLKRFWKGIRTNPVTFTGEIDFQNTTRYKGNEIATKAMLPTRTSQLTNDSNYIQYTDVKALEVGKYLDLHESDNMNVDYTFRISGDGTISRGNGAYIRVLDSGHLSINGSELWIE